MTQAEIRTILDDALMDFNVLRYRRANNLMMQGWQNVENTEGIKIIISFDGYDYTDFYFVISLTTDKKFKVTFYQENGELVNFVEKENNYRNENNIELLKDVFEDVLDAVQFGHEIVEYGDIELYVS